MSAAPKCANCGDSGSNPGSDFLDCIQCEVATARLKLEGFAVDKGYFGDKPQSDLLWSIHQRAYAMGVAAMRAEVAKAKTDSVRLDWLLENAWVSVLDIDTQVKYDSLRAALDAAMKVKP